MSQTPELPILIIDDSRDNRTVIEALLREALPDLRVLHADNGAAGLELAARHDPHVIILDLLMPGLDGFEVCERLKRDPATGHIPVIILTALGTDRQVRTRAVDCGAEGFLSKPVEALDLITMVRAMLKVRQATVSERRQKERLEALVADRTSELEQLLLKSRKVEQRARINEHLLTAYIDTNTDLIWLKDEKHRFLLVNETLARALGRPKDAIVGRIDLEVMAEADVERYRAMETDVLQHGTTLTGTFPIGTRTFETTLFRVSLSSGNLAIGGISRDVTDRLEAVRQIEQAALEWQHTFDSSNFAICILDRNHRVVRSNRVARELFGFDPAPKAPQCWEIFHEDGRRHAECPYLRAMQSRHRESMEFQVKDRIYKVTVDPILDADGILTGAVHIISDVTGKKQAERERHQLEAQLLQAQKMESIGQLAGGVAHDFNNMLSIIIGNTENAIDDLSADHPAWGALQEILQTAQRSAELTRQLLAFARKQEIHPQVLEVNRTVRGQLKMLGRLIGEQIRVRYLPQESDLHVCIDPAQLTQILVNLAVNARDAIGGPGVLTLETALLTREYVRVHSQLPPGDWVQLRVSDDGCGMSQDLIAHVFEPFFTTKDQGKGTGLGLATVWGIVKQNNGFIQVDSVPGKGTTFTVLLPASQEESDQAPAELSPTPQPHAPSSTILLVEDDPLILKLTQKVLSGLGFHVIATGSPLQALELAEAHHEELRMLVTDVVMPDLHGHELAQRVLARNPSLQVLFMSGYPADALQNLHDPANNRFYLSKPFTRAALAAKLHEVLSSRG